MSDSGEPAVAEETPPPRLTPSAPPPPSPTPLTSAQTENQSATVNAPPSTMPVISSLPTMFGETVERDITFCIDTSGSMFHCLHVIKEQLVETLMKHALREGDTTFNIIEFNSEVTQWANKMVSCTPETVQVAEDWIRKLAAKTGTNTMDALLTALQDSACQAVYLVTDGLPDTLADDILDSVVNAAKGRPIHCIYLARDKPETAAVEFLEDLAVESFGSLHIVTLTTHGCVERITPVYRAEHSHERVIRTVNNTLRPNFKTCSVATTLQIDPSEVLDPAARLLPYGTPGLAPFMPPWWGWRYWGLGMFPYRYNFPSTWNRYRPAKAWLKDQDRGADVPDGLGLSPAAGALLIGKQVLARRIADGCFYMGTVQSQILDDKFLVAFGPCKHGKYRETTYQDTFVFDVVDYCDAKRHTIITGDHVLAPWEPEGERYGPGKVIDGQERRQSVGPEDHQMTVAFSNGRTEKVALNKAIWIPQPVFERVSLELKMPQETRSTIMTTDHYPLQNLPGYPTSGPRANPPEFYTPENFSLEPAAYYSGWGAWPYPGPVGYYPPYPLVVRRKQEQREKLLTEDEDVVIPGTNMTRKQLDERIMSQLSEHRLVEAQATQESHTGSRLLKKRGKLEENSLKKSVTFNESELLQSAVDADAGHTVSDTRDTDSGFASSPELDMDSATLEQLDLIDEERRKIAAEKRWIEQEKLWLEEHERQMLETKYDPRLQFYRSPGVGKRPPWRYWRNDPAPDVIKSGGLGGSGGGGGGGSGGGGFRETALQAPLEARDQKRSAVTGSVEWTSPSFKYVDTFAKHDYSNSVEDCLKTPHPPPTQSTSGSYTVPASFPPTEDEKADARREYRRKRIIQRQMAWQERLQNEDRMKLLMEDGHRERIQAQITREQERQQQEQEMIMKAREAKKKISKELQERIEEKQKWEKERDAKRIESMKLRRERREALEDQKQKEIEETQQRREEIRRQNNVTRHNTVTERLNQEEARDNAINQQHRNAKLTRLHQFHTREDQAQAKKDLRVAVTDQHLALFKSQIFP